MFTRTRSQTTKHSLLRELAQEKLASQSKRLSCSLLLATMLAGCKPAPPTSLYDLGFAANAIRSSARIFSAMPSQACPATGANVLLKQIQRSYAVNDAAKFTLDVNPRFIKYSGSPDIWRLLL